MRPLTTSLGCWTISSGPRGKVFGGTKTLEAPAALARLRDVLAGRRRSATSDLGIKVVFSLLCESGNVVFTERGVVLFRPRSARVETQLPQPVQEAVGRICTVGRFSLPVLGLQRRVLDRAQLDELPAPKDHADVTVWLEDTQGVVRMFMRRGIVDELAPLPPPVREYLNLASSVRCPGCAVEVRCFRHRNDVVVCGQCGRSHSRDILEGVAVESTHVEAVPYRVPSWFDGGMSGHILA